MHLSETMNSGFYYLAPLLVFAPLVGLLINGFFGKYLSEKVVGAIASLASGTTFLVAVLLAHSTALNHGQVVQVPFAAWIHAGGLQLDWTFRVDTLSTTMMLVVSGVGTLIHIYAIGYMHEDVRFKHDEARFSRFFVFLNLFILSMMILVSGDSYLMLFVGWEGVGLCSFLLIGFWYELDLLSLPSWSNSNAAKKAFITSRIGDVGFLIAMFLTFWHFGSLQFDAAFQAAPSVAQVSPGAITAITLFMLLGVAGKSAQIPLYVWLPDAMAGPTPVSALIHAATMVTAGIYLIARSAPVYSLVPQAQYIVALVGAATALFAATIAVGQYDIKKVLAYSTISQLGFMVAAVGSGAFVAGMFHLITHAFFKALLFLSAGSVILGIERGHHTHAHHAEPKGKKKKEEHAEVFDPGDMRNMGGLRKTMPTTFWVYVVGTLALAGIVPFSGFWSKDEILLETSLHYPLIYWLLTAAAFFTAFYMGRQIWLVFFGEPRSDAAKHSQESPPVMTIPLIVLAALSLLGGALNLPFSGFHNLTHWLSSTISGVESLPFNWGVAGMSTLLAVLALVVSWFLYGRNPLKEKQIDPLKKPLGWAFTGMENKWFVDELYRAVVIGPYERLAAFLADAVDWKFWHDFVHDTLIVGGFNGLTKTLLDRNVDQRGIDAFFNSWGAFAEWLSANLRKAQNGFIRTYALATLLGVVLILGYLILK
ncbi:MAG: NADH-quinone oxidoreductase subunit L [Anaerolineales bacterium]|nr:NADH-quinone oxidoreductase subunit L [Anaerolineales bacterium]